MRVQLFGSVGLALVLWTGGVHGQDLAWRPARSAADAGVTLGRPQPLAANPGFQRVSFTIPAATLSAPQPIVRGQSPDLPAVNVPPPPPPGGGFGNPAVFPGGPAGPAGPSAPGRGLGAGEEAYNCGLINNDADLGGFWTRTGDKMKRCWSDITGAIDSGIGGRNRFQSDHEFDNFISPVSNPVFFEDPRSLTELRPIFIWQRTRDTNPVFAGGDNYFAMLQGRLALTERVSIVMNKLGWTWVDPKGGIPGYESANGFSELHIGPKFTFLRSEVSGTVGALGLNFEIPTGSSKVAADTGTLSLSPYFALAQKFWRTSYGEMNFMSTTGYSLSIDSKRTDFLYSSFHLDYNVLNANTFYPLIELNWTRYVMNGSARSGNFEGTNLFNFGTDAVAGHNDLTLALGFRYKFSEAIQFGIAGEFGLLGGSRHMEGFRVGADMIFRY